MIEQHVTSLELSMRLDELGVKKESVFCWADEKKIIMCTLLDEFVSEIHYAYLASELGEMLPNYIVCEKLAPFDNYRIAINKFISVNEQSHFNNYVISYECDSTEVHGATAWLRRKLTKGIYDPNLSNAMAKMLIHLIENGFVKAEDLK